MAYWDSTLHCRFANRAYADWHGLSSEAVLGRHMSEVLEGRFELNKPHIEAALRGEPQAFERDICMAEGEPNRHALISYVPDVVEGAVRGFFVTINDLSAVKDTELALRESEERFRLTFEEAPIGMALVAPDGHFVRVNRALCELVRYSAEELTGRTFQSITHPDDLDADLGLLERLARGEIPRYQLEKRYLRKDGSLVNVMLSVSILRRGTTQSYFIAQIEDISERKQLMEGLRDAEAISSGILNVSADAIVSVDEQQLITMFNQGAERIFGYSAVEVIGKPLDILVPEPLRSVHREHARRFASNHAPARRMGERDTEIFGLRKSGETFPADATISRLELGDRKLLTIALRDISERKRAEALLRQAQERFELALEGADLASWDWNVQTGEVAFNARWAELRGYELHELEPRVNSWLSGVHPDDLPLVQEALAKHFAGQTPYYEAEHRVRTKDGEFVWILDRGKVFTRDQAGRPLRMVGTELDVTDKRRVQAAQAFFSEVGAILASTLDLDETLRRIAALSLRELADCVIVDLPGRMDDPRRMLVLHADPNKAALCDRIKQFRADPRKSYVGSSLLPVEQAVLVPSVSREHLASIAQNADHLRALEELAPRSVMAVPLRGRHDLLGVLLFISSNPARRYDPHDLELAEELARRAVLAIENARLYESSCRATTVRDDVLGIVAHDLRNPLGTILLQSALSRRRGAPERRSTARLEAIERAARRMNRLIRDLLDVTRMEAGKLALEISEVDAERTLAECVEAQTPLAEAASLELSLDLNGPFQPILADRDRLLQVLENLIGNAIKFSASGGKINVGARTLPEEVVFWVRDAGPGISSEDQTHLFDRFWQGKKATHRGAGLGLPIAKGIVEAHRGRLWVESALGRGTTMFFTMPLAPNLDTTKVRPGKPLAPPTSPVI
jgi:PAS domain S-box-containing protein